MDEWLKLYLQKLDEGNRLQVDILQSNVLQLKSMQIRQDEFMREMREMHLAEREHSKSQQRILISLLVALLGDILLRVGALAL